MKKLQAVVGLLVCCFYWKLCNSFRWSASKNAYCATSQVALTYTSAPSAALNRIDAPFEAEVDELRASSDRITTDLIDGVANTEQLLHMLHLFKKKYGHVQVPSSYVIPLASNAWPLEYVGYELGKHTDRIYYQSKPCPILKKQLDELGFVWDRRANNDRKLLKALYTFLKLFDNVEVPRSYVVPSHSDMWPEELWDYRLGSKCDSIRSGGLYKHLRPELEKMGFRFQTRSLRRFSIADIMESLRVYRAKHQVGYVSRNFTIPANDEDYPKSMHGAALGCIYADIVYRGAHKAHHAQITALGFDIETASPRLQMLSEGVQCYKKTLALSQPSFEATLNSSGSTSFEIPYTFVVPHGSNQYPEHLWGFRLGRAYRNIIWARKKSLKYRKTLAKTGLSLLSTKEERFQDILEAARCFRAHHPTVKRVPSSFVVPHESLDYPAHLWGLKLGVTMCNIRRYGYFRQHHAKLEELGFATTVTARKLSTLSLR